MKNTALLISALMFQSAVFAKEPVLKETGFCVVKSELHAGVPRAGTSVLRKGIVWATTVKDSKGTTVKLSDIGITEVEGQIKLETALHYKQAQNKVYPYAVVDTVLDIREAGKVPYTQVINRFKGAIVEPRGHVPVSGEIHYWVLNDEADTAEKTVQIFVDCFVD